ncbi:MAG: hypothetical protein N3A66_03490 [Planctomycetota bacterium]|nr:hypothetical protein [Planctomycetota bacterium]
MTKALVCGLVFAGLALAHAASAAGGEKVFILEEPFGLEWGPDRVTYSVDFPQGEATAEGLSLADAAGAAVAVQVCDPEYWPDQSLKKAKIAFVISLKAGEKAKRILRWQKGKAASPATDLAIRETGDFIEMANALTGIRLPAGRKTFSEPADAAVLPGPILAVRLPNGKWVGKGFWQTDRKCLSYSAEVLARGPVFGRVKLRYEFEDEKFYAAEVELTAGQDLAVIAEEFNLSEGKRYSMSGLNGMATANTAISSLAMAASNTTRMGVLPISMPTCNGAMKRVCASGYTRRRSRRTCSRSWPCGQAAG